MKAESAYGGKFTIFHFEFRWPSSIELLAAEIEDGSSYQFEKTFIEKEKDKQNMHSTYSIFVWKQ